MEQFDDGGIGEIEKQIDRDRFWDRVSDLLRPSQQLVLELVLFGWTDCMIAGHMEISEVTVRRHRQVIVDVARNYAEVNDIDQFMLY